MSNKDTPYLNWHRPFNPIEADNMPFYESVSYFGFNLWVDKFRKRGENPWQATIVFMDYTGIKTEIISYHSGPKQAKIAAEERLAEKARAILIALREL